MAQSRERVSHPTKADHPASGRDGPIIRQLACLLELAREREGANELSVATIRAGYGPVILGRSSREGNRVRTTDGRNV